MTRAGAAVTLLCLAACTNPPVPTPDAGVPTDGWSEDLHVWPNVESHTNSDPWLAEHHTELRTLRPRVLLVNFVNGESRASLEALFAERAELIAESTRYQGWRDDFARPMLVPELAGIVDLQDTEVPPDHPFVNSTRLPRESPVLGGFGVDYGAFFDDHLADAWGVAPGARGLCAPFEAGELHEVWIHLDYGVPGEVHPAEHLALRRFWNADGTPDPGPLSRCGGLDCFDLDDRVPCEVTVSLFTVLAGAETGCFLETHAHALESIAIGVEPTIPYLARYYPEFTGENLDTRYGLPFRSWQVCPYQSDCLDYPNPTTVRWSAVGESGEIRNYDPVCGNLHFTPNGRRHLDLDNDQPVTTSCLHWRDGSGATTTWTGAETGRYRDDAPGCAGPWTLWWRQTIPGWGNDLRDDDGAPMKAWWPYLYY